MYSHIKKNSFKEGANGPARYRTSVIIPLSTDFREYKLEERATIENNDLVGLWVTKPGTKIGTNLTVATGSVFDSAALTLRIDTTDVMRRIYLHQILACNENGLPFEVSLPGKINLVESSLEVYAEGDIVANTALEIQVDYVKKVGTKY